MPGSTWRDRALCATEDLAAKAFGSTEDDEEKYNDEDAEWFTENVCLECPVMMQCLKWVTANPQEFGSFGGLTAADRNPREDTLEAQGA